MLAETVLEILRFFSRHELDAMQMYSRYLRDLVNRYAGDLPLRHISHVSASNAGSVSMDLAEGSAFAEDSHIQVQRPNASDYEALFRRVNNAFVGRWNTCFENDALLRCLRDHASDLRCRIDVLDLQASSNTNVDYALVDFVASSLKPQKLTSHIDAEQDWHVVLFDHESMRKTVKHVVHDFCTFYQMAAFINGIPRLFNVDALETFAFHACEDPTTWILHFVHAFKTANRAAKVVPHVAVVYGRDVWWMILERAARGPWHVSVTHSLGKPLRTDVAAPHRDYPSRREIVTVSDAALFIFENKKLGKKLELYSWEVEARTETRRLTHLSCHFMLQIVDL